MVAREMEVRGFNAKMLAGWMKSKGKSGLLPPPPSLHLQAEMSLHLQAEMGRRDLPGPSPEGWEAEKGPGTGKLQ